jgi:hypothetical protein
VLQERGHLNPSATLTRECPRFRSQLPCPRYRSAVIDHCWECGLAREDLAPSEFAPWPERLCGECRHNRAAYETEPEARLCAICGNSSANRPGWQVSVCSPACASTRHNRRRRLADHGDRVCAAPDCDEKFFATRADHIFCSDACQKRTRRKLGPVGKWFIPTEAEPF